MRTSMSRLKDKERMRLFSINELERFSGIKAHAIRTWEKRYQFLEPGRMPNNTRLYTIGDVEWLLDTTLLLEYGHRVSRIIALTEDERRASLAALRSDDARQKKQVNALLQHMFRNDTEAFEDLLDEALMVWGMEQAVEAVIIPFMQKVKLTAYHDTGIETHFVVTALRRKLILAIEKMKPVKEQGISALLFLPQYQHFDLMLLYMNYHLRKSGIKVYYLGTDISISNLSMALATKLPDRVYTYMADKKGFPVADYADLFRSTFPHLQLVVAYADDSIALPVNDLEHIRYCGFRVLQEEARHLPM